MAAMEPLCLLIGIDPKKFSKKEKQLLEVELYRLICTELIETHRQQYKHYFYLINFTKDQEDRMLEENLLQNILNEILLSGHYDLQGIACYTNIHEDVIWEIILGLNINPTAICLRKILELHRVTHPELYKAMGKKIIMEWDFY